MGLHILLIIYILLTIGNLNESFIVDKYSGTHLFILSLSFIVLLDYLKNNKLISSFYSVRYFLIIIFGVLGYSILLSGNYNTGFPKLAGLFATALFALFVARNYDFMKLVQVIIETGFLVGLITFFLVFLSPNIAIDHGIHEGDWKGIYDHKNVLGFFALLYFSASWYSFLFSRESRSWALINMAISYILIINSSSKTAILISLIMVILGFLGYIRIRYGLRHIMGILFFIGIIVFVFGLFTENITVNNIGSSTDYISIYSIPVPLTGRLTIWLFSIEALSLTPFFGYGFGGFWGVNINSDIYDYGLGDIVLNDSHNGFVDLFLSTGIIGGTIITMLLIYYFVQIYRLYLKNDHLLESFFYLYFFILFILINLTESLLFKATNFYQFLLFYIIFSFLYMKRKKYFLGKKER